jgi:hypothetical protein
MIPHDNAFPRMIVGKTRGASALFPSSKKILKVAASMPRRAHLFAAAKLSYSFAAFTTVTDV